MGRYIAYAVAAARAVPGLEIRVIDSYGRHGAVWMPARFVLACLALAGACLIGRADIVHIHMAHYGSALRKGIMVLIARACGARVVLHIHGSRFDTFCDALPSPLHRLLVAVLRQADRVVVIARPWQRYVESLGIASQRIVLIHNGAPDVGARTRRTDGPVALLALGELGPRKGTDTIVAALATPDLRGRPWRAVLAGDGAVDAYRGAIAAAGLADRIALLGWVDSDRAHALLREADILLLPSHKEGLPLAILEAMAAGLAIVTTPVGGIPDAITDGETGLLVPPGDTAALAAAIRRLIGDAGLRASLGARARARYLESFTMTAAFGKLLRLYQDLCPQTASPCLSADQTS
jgi:glycosyltransferase involved in cell wall biosynthesis